MQDIIRRELASIDFEHHVMHRTSPANNVGNEYMFRGATGGAPLSAFHTLTKDMSLIEAQHILHFDSGYLLSHPYFYEYTCAPLILTHLRPCVCVHSDTSTVRLAIISEFRKSFNLRIRQYFPNKLYHQPYT